MLTTYKIGIEQLRDKKLKSTEHVILKAGIQVENMDWESLIKASCLACTWIYQGLRYLIMATIKLSTIEQEQRKFKHNPKQKLRNSHVIFFF